jgi:hypothetical protein
MIKSMLCPSPVVHQSPLQKLLTMLFSHLQLTLFVLPRPFLMRNPGANFEPLMQNNSSVESALPLMIMEVKKGV